MKKLMAMIVLGLGIQAVGPIPAVPAQSPGPGAAPKISANVGLSAFMSLSDNHLKKMADSMKVLSQRSEVQSGDWERIRDLLRETAEVNVEAVNWFAVPTGEYWTVQEGHAAGSLSVRPYFQKLLDGKTVLGDLVVSQSTGKSVAVVAVPVFGKNGKMVGALGASVYLDKLAERLRSELGATEGMIYYSFDSKPLIGINWDPSLILLDPMQLGKEVRRAFDDMLRKNEGIESYVFRGERRTVVFRRSEVTGWWYAFGVVENR